MSDYKPKKVTMGKVFAAGTLLALVLSVPMIVVIVVLYYIVKAGVLITGVAGIITLFIAMGFGFKISKKLAKVQEHNNSSKDLEKK
jgi:ABC-type transport system involved in cytochrome bd biosynthesis fused ATPase/permease subunit